MIIKAKLLKPLDGRAVGEHVEFSQADFDRLFLRCAVEAVPAFKAAPPLTNKMAKTPANKSQG